MAALFYCCRRPLANFLLAIGLLTFIYINGVPQLPAQIQMPAENTLAAKLEMEQGDESCLGGALAMTHLFRL